MKKLELILPTSEQIDQVESGQEVELRKKSKSSSIYNRKNRWLKTAKSISKGSKPKRKRK